MIYNFLKYALNSFTINLLKLMRFVVVAVVVVLAGVYLMLHPPPFVPHV